MATSKTIDKDYDLICVGAGIMSATLALMVKMVNKDKRFLYLKD